MAVAGRVGIVPRGTYTAGDSYMRLDYVKYGNSTYLCKKDCIDVLPTDAEYWMLVTTNAITDTSDLIVKFEEERVRENIHTDETHAKLFGKIRKWFADLKNVAFSGSYSDLTDTPDIDGMNEKIQECFKSASNGKSLVASAITGMGVETASDATYATMAENITNIKTHEGTATVDDVLIGKTFSNDEDMGLTGTMPNHSGETVKASSATHSNNNTIVTIPQNGYYDTNSKVSIADSSISGGRTEAVTVVFEARESILGHTSPTDYSDIRISVNGVVVIDWFECNKGRDPSYKTATKDITFTS
jgi:hypothetical protein